MSSGTQNCAESTQPSEYSEAALYEGTLVPPFLIAPGPLKLQDRGMIVRPGQEGDVAGIGLVHVRSWQAAYQGHFPQDFLDEMDSVRWSARWTRFFNESPGDREALLVSEEAGEVVGFVNVGPSRDDGEAFGEVRAIYLMPELWGLGFGRTLMLAALSELSARGFGEVMLWALDAETRARRFYEATGWRFDGSRREISPFGFEIPEVRYRISLD